jgi:hypothetical protein
MALAAGALGHTFISDCPTAKKPASAGITRPTWRECRRVDFRGAWKTNRPAGYHRPLPRGLPSGRRIYRRGEGHGNARRPRDAQTRGCLVPGETEPKFRSILDKRRPPEQDAFTLGENAWRCGRSGNRTCGLCAPYLTACLACAAIFRGRQGLGIEVSSRSLVNQMRRTV